MEKNYQVIVDATLKEDGRMYLNLKQPSEGVSSILTIEEIRPILAGGLAMSIRASKDEPKAMREVIQYLEEEFVNSDSFSDLKLRKFGK
jgi:hypothetical protein